LVFPENKQRLSFWKQNMQILYYNGAESSHEGRLESALLAAVHGRKVERFTRLADFRERMHSFVEPDSIAVLAAGSGEELREMQDFSDMLQDICIILVIPDWKESTIRHAHLLRPRFFCQSDDDFTDLNQIVSRMIQTTH
jgi:hypothetical protein